MARLRTIKPGFFQNETLAELTMATRLLFIGLWTIADRRGILEDRPKRIKAQLFPYEDFDVDAALNELADGGFITRYVVDGVAAIHICKFAQHQTPHKHETANDLPEPDEHKTSTVHASDKHDTSTVHASPVFGSGNLEQGSGDLGVESLSPDGDEPEPAKPVPMYSPEFEAFWREYPTGHGSKKVAYGHWRKLKPDERARLPDALAAWNDCERWRSGYVKSAELWIRDRLWDQPPPPPKPRTVNGDHRGPKGPDFAARVREMEAQERALQ